MRPLIQDPLTRTPGVCNPEQRPCDADGTLDAMEPYYYKFAVAAAWVLVIGLAGMVSGVTTLPAMAALAAVTLVPPAVMLHLWNDPQQTLSESIHEVRRR
jgi:hypothetical protein